MSRRPTNRSRGSGRRSSGRGGAKRARALPSETVEVDIDYLGAGGDGVASWLDKTLYVPGALAGERVRVKTGQKRGDGIVAEVMDVIDPSPDRAIPPCQHFGRCGGCQLQHLNPDMYGKWKRERVVKALSQRGFEDVEVLAPVLVGPGTRRRVTFTAEKQGKKCRFGFNARASHDIESVDSCPLLVDDLNAIIEPLKNMLATVLTEGTRARIFVTQCENGADILIEGGTSPELAARETIAAMVAQTDVAQADRINVVRVAWKEDKFDPEPIAQSNAPLVNLSGVLVELPMGSFLQPSVEGEQAILAQVKKGVEGAKRVADLYCGLGSFSLPLSRDAIVRAIDLTPASVRAMERAAGRADLGGRVIAEVRNLDRQPLEVKELAKFDAIVFDPPRGGAAAQVQHLCESGVKNIVAVSCNPATFARDAKMLVDGGFRLVDVLPVDQFTYSTHVELVARFVRDDG